jgi:hypothetical protein
MERTRVDPDLYPVRGDREVESSNKDDGRRGIEYIDVEGRGRDKKCVTTEKDKTANVVQRALAR